MAEKNKIIRRFLVDFGAAFTGLTIGGLYLYVFSDGLTLPLSGSDSLILISTMFTALLLSSVFDKFISQILRSSP